MSIHLPAKSPTENNVSYDLDWSGRVNPGDGIATSVWAVVGLPASFTITDGGHAGLLTKFFANAGTPNATYTMLNTITMTSGEGPYTRKVSLLIKDQ